MFIRDTSNSYRTIRTESDRNISRTTATVQVPGIELDSPIDLVGQLATVTNEEVAIPLVWSEEWISNIRYDSAF